MSALDRAVEALWAGGVVGLPTDTVYGLAALPRLEEAVGRLYLLKGRPPGRPIALLVGSVEAAAELVRMPAAARDLAGRHWPGALTLVLEAAVELPEWVGHRGRTVGVRMPAHDTALEVLGRTGPLAVTSANRSGEEPAVTDREARAVFGPEVDAYLPGRSGGGLASTVVDLTGPDPVVLRQGPVRI